MWHPCPVIHPCSLTIFKHRWGCVHKSQAFSSCYRDCGELSLTRIDLCYSIIHAHHFSSNQRRVHNRGCLWNASLLLSRNRDPRGSLVLLLCLRWEYWWDLAASNPPRHKHFFHRALPNKTVINKTPALLPFQHPKAKQDAEAAETLPRCLSWRARDWLYGMIPLLPLMLRTRSIQVWT